MKVKFIKPYMLLDKDGNSDGSKVPGDVIDVDSSVATWLVEQGVAKHIKENNRWRAERGEEYYCIDSYGNILVRIEEGFETDDNRYKSGNYFKSEVAVKRYQEYLMALRAVHDDKGALTPEEVAKCLDEHKMLYHVHIHPQSHSSSIDMTCTAISHVNNIVYFDNRDNALISSRAHKAEWITIADYDWSVE